MLIDREAFDVHQAKKPVAYDGAPEGVTTYELKVRPAQYRAQSWRDASYTCGMRHECLCGWVFEQTYWGADTHETITGHRCDGKGKKTMSARAMNEQNELRQLVDFGTRRKELEHQIEETIFEARLNFVSWEDIAYALGVTKQAVHQRYAHKVNKRVRDAQPLRRA